MCINCINLYVFVFVQVNQTVDYNVYKRSHKAYADYYSHNFHEFFHIPFPLLSHLPHDANNIATGRYIVDILYHTYKLTFKTVFDKLQGIVIKVYPHGVHPCGQIVIF